MENTDELKPLFTKLVDEGATSIEIYYEGGGDSGWIEEVNTDNDVDINKDELEVLEEWAYDVLAKHLYYDWVNNEGGYGWIRVNLEEVTFNIEGYARTVEEEGVSEQKVFADGAS